LALDLIGGIIILVDAIPYVALGDRGLLGGLYSPIFGIYGTVFAITILVFAFIGYFAERPLTTLLGVLMAAIGFVVMIAAYMLAFDFVSVFAGLIAALGGILMIPRKG
jgi:membrane-bound ClpP family serine protease